MASKTSQNTTPEIQRDTMMKDKTLELLEKRLNTKEITMLPHRIARKK